MALPLRWRRLAACLIGLVLLNACDRGPLRFVSSQGKEGNASTRGAMTDDLIRSGRLAGKPRAEVEASLGPPDHREARWFGYKVVTIARCYVWDCSMDVVFDPTSGRVESVAVSD
jgi:hypothetical protein